MPGTVVVLMPAADIRGSDARTLTASCTAALREGECVVSENATPAAIAVATVTVRAAGKVHIDVDVRATDASPSRHPSRDLIFRDADPLEERWKSVGFAIASMSGAAGDVAPGASADGTTKEGTEASGPSATASGPSAAASAASGAPAGDAKNDATPETPAATPEQKPAPNSNGPATRAPQNAPPQEDDIEGAHRFRASGAFETGPGLTHGTWRVGGALGLGYDFDDGFWAVDALGGYAANPADVSGVDVSWLTFAAGASVAWRMYGVQGRVGALLGAREVRASESDGATGEHQTLTRWLPVGIARASLRWPATGTLGMFSGLSLARTTGGTAIASHGTYIGSSAAFELGLFLGVEVRP
jgi:hypothetical protein